MVLKVKPGHFLENNNFWINNISQFFNRLKKKGGVLTRHLTGNTFGNMLKFLIQCHNHYPCAISNPYHSQKPIKAFVMISWTINSSHTTKPLLGSQLLSNTVAHNSMLLQDEIINNSCYITGFIKTAVYQATWDALALRYVALGKQTWFYLMFYKQPAALLN